MPSLPLATPLLAALCSSETIEKNNNNNNIASEGLSVKKLPEDKEERTDAVSDDGDDYEGRLVIMDEPSIETDNMENEDVED